MVQLCICLQRARRTAPGGGRRGAAAAACTRHAGSQSHCCGAGAACAGAAAGTGREWPGLLAGSSPPKGAQAVSSQQPGSKTRRHGEAARATAPRASRPAQRQRTPAGAAAPAPTTSSACPAGRQQQCCSGHPACSFPRRACTSGKQLGLQVRSLFAALRPCCTLSICCAGSASPRQLPACLALVEHPNDCLCLFICRHSRPQPHPCRRASSRQRPGPAAPPSRQQRRPPRAQRPCSSSRRCSRRPRLPMPQLRSPWPLLPPSAPWTQRSCQRRWCSRPSPTSRRPTCTSWPARPRRGAWPRRCWRCLRRSWRGWCLAATLRSWTLTSGGLQQACFSCGCWLRCAACWLRCREC